MTESQVLHSATKGVHCNEKQAETQIENIGLDAHHTEFLLAHHGTTELEPLPPADAMHPLNWPVWRKNTFLIIFAIHGSMAGFTAAGLVPVLPIMATKYSKSLEATTYFASTAILLYGITPFLWLPLMDRFGHHPCLLASVLGATVCNVGSIFCTTYGEQMLCRSLAAIFTSPPCALGSVVVTQLFFRHERATKLGIWKAFWTAGAPGGPFILGFVAEHAGLSWVFGVMAIANFVIFLAYLAFGRETWLWQIQNQQNILLSSLGFGKFNLYAWSLREAVEPFKVFQNMRILIPACAYALVFAYANVAVAITVPQVAGSKFHLDSQGIGLQFIAMIIGLVIGEAMGGIGSDYWMKRISGIPGRKPRNEDRLWLAYPGFALSATGLLIWGVTTQQATPGKWIVTPSIGAAIAFVGCQLVTTVLVTYVIDVNPAWAAQTGLIVNFLRQTWSFVGPFYYTPMFRRLGYGGTGGVMAAIVGVVPTAAILFVHFGKFGLVHGSKHYSAARGSV